MDISCPEANSYKPGILLIIKILKQARHERVKYFHFILAYTNEKALPLF